MTLLQQLQTILAGAPAGHGPIAFVGDAKLARQVARAGCVGEAALPSLVVAQRHGRRRSKRDDPPMARLSASPAAMPLAAASLSALVSLRAACRAEQPEALVGSWCRLLRRGGKLVLVEPSSSGGVLAAMRRMGSEAIDPEDVTALLLEAGLAPISQRQIGSMVVTWGTVTEATAMRQGQSAPG